MSFLSRLGAQYRATSHLFFYAKFIIFGGCVLIPAGLRAQPAGTTVVISEVHYHPADDSQDGEFVELHNYGSETVRLDGWFLVGGVQHVFEEFTSLTAGGYLLVANNAAELVDRNVVVLNDRGTVYTPENVRERLSMRNFMKDLRERGLPVDEEGKYGPKEVQAFANAFDREIRKKLK